jgi:hypothetical protein
MKSRTEIEARLRKLRTRYAHKYVDSSQRRCFRNCVYNHVHVPTQVDRSVLDIEYEMAPRKQTTLIVRDESSSIHLCMYGSDNPATWPGSICDSDDIAKRCPWFKPRVAHTQARQEFLDKLADDEYVFDNYRDVATLQWVLGERIHERGLSLWEKFWFWLKAVLWKPIKPLPPAAPSVLPEDLWANMGPSKPESSHHDNPSTTRS